MRPLLAAVALSLATASGAAADVFDDCRAAVIAEDRNAAKRAADVLLVGRGTQVPEEHREIAAQCIELGRERPYAFSKLQGRFKPVAQAEAENEQFADREKRLADEKEATLEQIRINQMAEAERARRAEVERAVTIRLAQACNRKFKADPDAAILNSLCYDIFKVTGLPE